MPIFAEDVASCTQSQAFCRHEFKRRLLREFKRRQFKVRIFPGFRANGLGVLMGLVLRPKIVGMDGG